MKNRIPYEQSTNLKKNVQEHSEKKDPKVEAPNQELEDTKKTLLDCPMP